MNAKHFINVRFDMKYFPDEDCFENIIISFPPLKIKVHMASFVFDEFFADFAKKNYIRRNAECLEHQSSAGEYLYYLCQEARQDKEESKE